MNQTIAHQFREAREKLGLSLEDAAHETRIPLIRLQQMEQGNFAAFGSMAYARSFVALYGRFLGVNVEAFVEVLPRPVLGGASDYRYLTTSLGPWIDPVVRHRLSPHSPRRPEKRAENQGLHAFLIFLGIAACMAILGVEFFTRKGLTSINQSPMSTVSVTDKGRPSVGKSVSASVQATKSEGMKKVPFTSPKTSAGSSQQQGDRSLVATNASKQANVAPPHVAEEVRAPDVSGLPVRRAEPVIDDNEPTDPGM